MPLLKETYILAEELLQRSLALEADASSLRGQATDLGSLGVVALAKKRTRSCVRISLASASIAPQSQRQPRRRLRFTQISQRRIVIWDVVRKRADVCG